MSTETVRNHTEAITQVKVPLPFPLRWVNGYIVRGKDGITVIDPGLHTADGERVWDEALRTQGLSYGDIEQIVLTHHHPDHYGLAGWMQEKSGAPVLLSAEGARQAAMLWGDGTPMTGKLLALFRSHGLDESLIAPMRDHMDGFVPMVSPQPRLTPIGQGDRIRLGGREYEALHTPGHALGHLCFYGAEERTIFCGDHVLPQITPNVSYLPDADGNPLGAFLHSLQEIAKLPVAAAYPGHREPFERFAERALDIVRHHHLRLEQMKAMMAAGPHTAYEVCGRLFGDRLSLHQMRFALAETLAHLVYMEQTGAADSRADVDGIVRFRVRA